MARNGYSRRTLLGGLAGAGTVAIAGCTGSDDSGGSVVEQELNPDDWEDVGEIRLEGHTNGWIGQEPGLIEGVRNPTLLFFEGQAYDLTWENRDGFGHNIELRDEDNSVVGGHRTSIMSGRGETQTLEFQATDELHAYLCAPHPRSMTGYIHVVD